MVLEENAIRTSTNGSEQEMKIDEIKSFLECRYLSACEACWRIFEFDIQYQSLGVERFPFHLPEENVVTFRDSDYLNNVVNRLDVQKTMFTEWMEANAKYGDARELGYVDFPTKWVWNSQNKAWKMRKFGKCIGRMFYVHPSSGERFYLRMLLNIVKGVQSFEEIRTINGVTYETYKATCYVLGLLDEDKEWHGAIVHASQWSARSQLRQLFVTCLLFCEVSKPLKLWEDNWDLLSDYILYRQRRILNFPQLTLTEAQLKNLTLYEIEQILQKNNRSLKDFPPLSLLNHSLIQDANNRLMREELSYDIQRLIMEHKELYNGLNVQQMNVHDIIV